MTEPREFLPSLEWIHDPEALEAYLLASKYQDHLPPPLLEELPEDYEPILSQHEMQHADDYICAISP